MWDKKDGAIKNKNDTQTILRLINIAAKMNRSYIYDVEFQSYLVKIYIDNDKEKVDLNLCEKFMKNLLFLFHSEGIEEVQCEVSSPGLERKLKKDWHFKSAIGKKVKVQTRQPVFCQGDQSEKKRQTKTLVGQLHKYYDQKIDVSDGSLEWTVPLNIITKANVVFEHQSKKV